jgi:hypothetical protein
MEKLNSSPVVYLSTRSDGFLANAAIAARLSAT